MTSNEDEHLFPSTTWAWRKVKIHRAPQARHSAGASRHRWRGCYPWPREQKITLTFKYRGGAEAWYLVEARGRHGVMPGHAALHDVLQEVMNRP